jgi:septal ring factor EnvC (AmiA/AmiB activator)
MHLRTLVLAAGLALALAGGATGQEEQPAKPRGTAPRAAAAKPPSVDIAAFLKQLAEAQRGLSDQMQQQKERMDWFHGELTAQQDRIAAVEQELKAMRDEVKGLYVESSAVKQAIDALKEDIASVNSNVSGFRTYSGFFIAVMILLLAVIFVLSIRR